MEFTKINHVQLCIPPDKEEEARVFYCGILGLKEIEKPDDLKKSGGFWLEIAGIELHIGVEENTKVSKAHPAFEVNKINAIKKELLKNSVTVRDDYTPIPGYNRFSFFDPFDNRIELMEKETPAK